MWNAAAANSREVWSRDGILWLLQMVEKWGWEVELPARRAFLGKGSPLPLKLFKEKKKNVEESCWGGGEIQEYTQKHLSAHRMNFF